MGIRSFCTKDDDEIDELTRLYRGVKMVTSAWKVLEQVYYVVARQILLVDGSDIRH